MVELRKERVGDVSSLLGTLFGFGEHDIVFCFLLPCRPPTDAASDGGLTWADDDMLSATWLQSPVSIGNYDQKFPCSPSSCLAAIASICLFIGFGYDALGLGRTCS